MSFWTAIVVIVAIWGFVQIVTDSGYHLTSEIDRLRDEKGVN